MVMDDQFYVVPEALASAVFSFGASRTVTYDSPDWCTEPPLRNCRQRAGPGICRYRARFSEMDLTHFVAVRHKLPVVVIAVPAFLSTQGVDANRDDQGVCWMPITLGIGTSHAPARSGPLPSGRRT